MIKGIPPQLPVLGKMIRRATGNGGRETVCIQQKLFPVRIHITTVMGNVNRHVPDQPDSLVIGIGAHILPLSEKCILDKRPDKYRLRIRLTDLPGIPRLLPVCLFQCHERTEFGNSRMPGKPIENSRTVADPTRGTRKQRKSLPPQAFILAGIRGLLPCMRQLLRGQQSVFMQQIQADKPWISSEGRVRFIRGIALIRHAKRQNLPIGKAALCQKINETVAIRSEIPHGIYRRQ